MRTEDKVKYDIHAVALARVCLEAASCDLTNPLDLVRLNVLLGTAKAFANIVLKKQKLEMPGDYGQDEGA